MIIYNPGTKKYLLANFFTFKAESFDISTLIQRIKFKPDRTRSLKQGIVRKIARYYKTRLGRKRAKLFAKIFLSKERLLLRKYGETINYRVPVRKQF